MKHGALTVRELIERLSKLDPELPVLTDGCDCWGEATSVQVIDESRWHRGTGDWVLVSRDPEPDPPVVPEPYRGEP